MNSILGNDKIMIMIQERLKFGKYWFSEVVV